MALSPRRIRQRRLDVLRRVLANILEENGSSFSMVTVASNGITPRGETRIIDATLLAGYVPDYVRRALLNLVRAGHILEITSRTYRLDSGGEVYLQDISRKNKKSEEVLEFLSTQEIPDAPQDEVDAGGFNPFDDDALEPTIPEAPSRRPRSLTVETIKSVLSSVAPTSLNAREVVSLLREQNTLPKSQDPVTYIRFLLSATTTEFERDLSKPRGYYRLASLETL